MPENEPFQSELRNGETVLWTGQPVLIPYLVPVLPLPIITFFFIGLVIAYPQAVWDTPYRWFYLVVMMFPMWLGFVYFLYLFATIPLTRYAYTDQRIIVRTGLWRKTCISVEYDRIRELKLTTGITHQLFRVGTVKAFSGKLAGRVGKYYEGFVAIKEPEKVMQGLEQAMALRSGHKESAEVVLAESA
jgi:uncharacterized membrane protein YdbT with pleckstrin-like domain